MRRLKIPFTLNSLLSRKQEKRNGTSSLCSLRGSCSPEIAAESDERGALLSQASAKIPDIRFTLQAPVKTQPPYIFPSWHFPRSCRLRASIAIPKIFFWDAQHGIYVFQGRVQTELSAGMDL